MSCITARVGETQPPSIVCAAEPQARQCKNVKQMKNGGSDGRRPDEQRARLLDRIKRAGTEARRQAVAAHRSMSRKRNFFEF
jgi:hypothetical protein